MYRAWAYVLTNNRHTVLYVGFTNDLARRLWEHRTNRRPKCVTARYEVHKLIYYEGFNSIAGATAREKFIKGKSRKWKEALIEKMNSEWHDLGGVADSL
jgi:putative endonuclease